MENNNASANVTNVPVVPVAVSVPTDATIEWRLKNRIRWTDVDGTVKVTVNPLKASHFGKDELGRATAKAYKEHILRLETAVVRMHGTAGQPGAKEIKERVISAIQSTFDFLRVSCRLPEMTAYACDAHFIESLSLSLRTEKNTTNRELLVKSLAGMSALVEELVFYRLNNIKIPKIRMNTNDAERMVKILEREKEAAEKAAREKAVKAEAEKEAREAAEKLEKEAAEKLEKEAAAKEEQKAAE